LLAIYASSTSPVLPRAEAHKLLETTSQVYTSRVTREDVIGLVSRAATIGSRFLVIGELCRFGEWRAA
jgi:hypothetical protein